MAALCGSASVQRQGTSRYVIVKVQDGLPVDLIAFIATPIILALAGLLRKRR
jgi:hypothetical protein